MKPILLASTFVLVLGSSALAQLPVPQPAPILPPSATLPPAPAVPGQVHPAPFPSPAVTWTVPPVPPVVDVRIDDIVMMAMAQKEKEQGKINPVKVEPFRFYMEANNASQAENLYSQARSFIERDQYDRAMEPLDKVINAKIERADAAMYWKAYSLLKLARRDEALTTLTALQKQYPTSRWVGDARALEVEIKQAAGQPVAADASNDDLKLLALQGILRTDPEAAFPVVEKMLAGGASVRVKERAIYVLSQSRSDRAREIIGNVARGTSNPDLQLTAIRYLGISNSPDAITTMTTIYRGDVSLDARRAVISALARSQNSMAVSALVTLARAEKNPELKTTIVRHLSNSSSPEAKAYMLELLK